MLSYLTSQNIRSIDSISGELLSETVDANKRLVELSDLTEESLWDDVGIVAGEEYREPLYTRLGFLRNNQHAESSGIGNSATYAHADL